MHECVGSDCSFCAWRRDNPIELGWERLLNDSDPLECGARLYGVDLTCSQVDNPDCQLSTQQTADFWLIFTTIVYSQRLITISSKSCSSMTLMLRPLLSSLY